MAIIRFINAKNKSRQGLRKVINYVQLPSKTREELITTIGCSPKTAFEEFSFTKNFFNKNYGRQFIHFTQSFSPGDPITPEQAHEIGQKLIERHKQFEGFQIVMTTHTDKNHLHNHFVINTVNRDTGKKWQQSPYDLAEMKDLSDEIAAEYGAYIIEHHKEGYVNNGEFKAAGEERGWKKELQNAIWEARKASTSKEEFIENMEKLGYQVDWDYKKETPEEEHFQSIIEVCKRKADSIESFEKNLNFYDIELEWVVKATINDENFIFNNKEELDKYIDKLENANVEWTDEIKFTRDGKSYSPEHFEKVRFDGTILRDAFEINSQNEINQKLPKEEDIKALGKSDKLQRLTLAVKACKQCSQSQEEFVKNMETLGYEVDWNPKHKYIVFHVEGQKIRNRMLRPNKNFTKETFNETFKFNETMKNIIDTNNIKSYDELIKFAKSKKGQNLNLSINKKNNIEIKVKFEGEEKKCFFFKSNLEQMMKEEKNIPLQEEEEIYKALNVETIMFTTSDGKKCSSKKFFPQSKYTKEGFEESFEFNAKWQQMQLEREKFNAVLSIINTFKSEGGDHSKYPLTRLNKQLEGAALKEYILQQKRGRGLGI